MTAVQETEVLTDDELPPPTALFPSSQEKDDVAVDSSQKTSVEDKQQTHLSTSVPSLVTSRPWLRFRRSSSSPGRKERSRSPPKATSEDKLEDLAVAARPNVPVDAATEASIEITLSIPKSTESEDLVSPLAEKSVTSLTLPSRPSSSWFGFRRSLKSSSSGSKNVSSSIVSLVKEPVQSETLYQADLLPSATERTAAMEDDWFQEVMSQSTGTTSELVPWLNESGQQDPAENVEKSSCTSRGQSSWFGFKRSSKVASHDDQAWKGQENDDAWLPSAAIAFFEDSSERVDPTIIINTDNEHRNSNGDDIFRTRTRLSTESTIPSVATEDECSDSEGYSKEFEQGATQSFNFLKI